MNIAGCNPPSFKVHNTLGKDIILNISYTTEWNTAFGSRSQNHQGTISIPQYSDSDSLMGSCLDIGSGSIPQESIKYIITSPELLILKNEQVTKQKEICKKCENNICLNNGTNCNPLYDDSKCGSGICNIAGFCGGFKVVDCPNNFFNCNNKICLKINSIDFPNGVEKGCEKACIYGGENGKCFENPEIIKKRWIVFIITFLFVVLSILFFVFYKKLGGILKRLSNEIKQLVGQKEDLEKEIPQLENKKGVLENLIKESNKKIYELESQKKEIQLEIKDLEEKLKGSKGDLKQKYEKELVRLKEKNIETEENLKIRRRKLIEEETKLRKKENELIIKKQTLIKDSFENYRNEQLSKYQRKYDRAGIDISYDPKQKYFIVTYRKSKKQTSLQRYVYSSYFNLNKDQIVHHIDFDPLNNEIENLIALSQEDHNNRFNHGKVILKDWKFGIEQLKKQLGWKDSDFPEHIKNEIKRRKEQTKLNP